MMVDMRKVSMLYEEGSVPTSSVYVALFLDWAVLIRVGGDVVASPRPLEYMSLEF